MTYQTFWKRLAAVCGENEAKAVARMVFEDRCGLSLADVFVGKDSQLSAEQGAELEEILGRLLQNEPVQYVLGWADFCGHRFAVEPGVLIPRPETEELCEWVKVSVAGRPELRILDACCGSGCIGIALALGLPGTRVSMYDISPVACRVSQFNAAALSASVNVFRHDARQPLPAEANRFDVVVSNPPYITPEERSEMERNVLDHEPELALFVPGDQPLVYYAAIAAQAKEALKPGGMVFFEINPKFVAQMQETLSAAGFGNIEVRMDGFGRQRMMKAVCLR